MEAVAVDWSQAPMTDAAKNTKTPDRRICVAVCPREVFDKYHPMTWAEVEAATFRGDDGLAPLVIMLNDSTLDHAYFREGLASERLLAGRPVLLRQGW